MYGMEDYVGKSNRESGNGRTDLGIRPALYDEPAGLFEFRIAEKFRELEARAKAALEQIEEKQYDEKRMEPGYERIVRSGIAFLKELQGCDTVYSMNGYKKFSKK